MKIWFCVVQLQSLASKIGITKEYNNFSPNRKNFVFTYYHL